jgi:polyisoprenoid-binding protein YceI
MLAEAQDCVLRGDRQAGLVNPRLRQLVDAASLERRVPHPPRQAHPDESGASRRPVAPLPTFATGRVAAGNEARYRVREQLAGFDFPNDAVGVTDAVSGEILLDAQGNLIPGGSRIVVDISGLTSDRDRRDNFLRRRTLETEQYPTVTLVPTQVRGVRVPVPTSGEQALELVGALTVKDVTRATTWQIQVRYDGERVTGTAVTSFAFEEFGLEKPRVASVLSVDDAIRLEYDFVLEVRPAEAASASG